MTELVHEQTSCDGSGMIITTPSSFPSFTTTTRSLGLNERMDAGFIAICVVLALLFTGGILAVICIITRKHIIGRCCYYWGFVSRVEQKQGALPPSQCSLPPPCEPPDGEDTGFRDQSYEMDTHTSNCTLAHQHHGQRERITKDFLPIDNTARNCTDGMPRRNGTVKRPRPGYYQPPGFHGELRQIHSDVLGGTTYYIHGDFFQCDDKSGIPRRVNGAGVINHAYVTDFNDGCPENWSSQRHNTNTIFHDVTDSSRDARNSSNVSYTPKPSKGKNRIPLKKKKEKENEESYCKMDGHFHDLDIESDTVCAVKHLQELPQFPILRKRVEEAHRRAESSRKTLEQRSLMKCDETAKTPEHCGLNGSCDADGTTQAPAKVKIQKRQSILTQFVVTDEMLQQSLKKMARQRAERKKCSNPNALPPTSGVIPQNCSSHNTSDPQPKPKDFIPNDFNHTVFPDPHLNPVVNPVPDYRLDSNDAIANGLDDTPDPDYSIDDDMNDYADNKNENISQKPGKSVRWNLFFRLYVYYDKKEDTTLH